ncbi:MAG: hypothetical protein AAF693_21820 [Bacteroidota bacterium]
MKYIVAVMTSIIASSTFAQNGYIITKEGSLIKGFIRYQRNFHDGHLEVEVWKSKKDKNPIKYPTKRLKEYAIKKDTFKIITNYYPFKEEATFIPYIELKVESRGKLNLYSTLELNGFNWSAPAPNGMNGYASQVVTYILENANGNRLVVQRDRMIQDLDYFLDYNKFARKVSDKKFKYRDIPALIKYYNQQ